MDINFNWDLYDFGTEKIKFRLKVAYECFNHTNIKKAGIGYWYAYPRILNLVHAWLHVTGIGMAHLRLTRYWVERISSVCPNYCGLES
eukprot:SAG11_NODE_82_length_17639_cov_6.427594_4_plen_88_part_00